ncbi:hypothetical protein BDN70DRAFT_871349 [Pholiota conissans]|uniref:Uncharacterized protein n=1 Tax=Pholiota conissans TaxID=109636 RepID=A0A9P5ZG78_9AGAR|nr:hypothetical protein BDN70DRAFT_871349 [Pholiota conissans]
MASPFHRPPPFQFPRGPPSPPDTNSDTVIPGMPIPISSSLPLSGQDFGAHDTSLLNTSPDPRLKKSSSIQYHLSGLRDTKDRASPSHLRGGKPLIIIIPPSNLLQDRGSTLTGVNGPLNRLSHGVVMPLFPSLFGQLTAIAREFNFPSTSGLCLYYHYTEDGITLTPRISEDSWQTLWVHLSDPPLPNERRHLISGKVEFDVDHRLARWYGPWISTMHRELSDSSQLYPHTAPSHVHFRGESRTTVTDGRLFEDDAGENFAIQQHSAPIVRHAPRKLSLVERFESPSRSEIKSTPHALATPPEHIPTSSQVLSPIVQEDEPKSARHDLNSRVKSWRASAQLCPTPLAATGQTSLEPPNLPNSIVLDRAQADEVEELNMEDYIWSISSAGPLSPGEMSPIMWSRVPSVHLDTRLEGSVCSTPSIQTSYGPLDCDDFSLLEYVQPSRVSSPDIAHRLYEHRPETPLTSTTWGAPLSCPPSPLSFSRVASPDLAQRLYENVPDTPLTATSWGAPLSYPPSPPCLSPVPSLDLGERSTFDDSLRQFKYDSPSIMDTESFPPFNRPWSHVWPYTEHNQTDSLAENTISDAEIPSTTDRPWSHVWPYTETGHTDSILQAWPFAERTLPNFPNEKSISESRNAPSSIRPWSHVWPYTESVPLLSNNAEVTPSADISSVTPRQWSHVWPYNERTQSDYGDGHLASESAKPRSRVCPHSQHKEEVAVPLNPSDQSNAIKDSRVWPYVWPYITLDAGYTSSWTFGYPNANIYQPLYPYLNIYPPMEKRTLVGPVGTGSYFTPIDYPHNLLAIYPAFQRADAYPHNLSNIYPTMAGSLTPMAHNRAHSHSFDDPSQDAVHIAVLDSLGHISAKTSQTRHSDAESYPFFNLYPPLQSPFFSHLSLYMYGPRSQYPEFEIYPPLPVHVSAIKRSEEAVTLPSSKSGGYPNFNLYPHVYPYFDLYGNVVEVENDSNPKPSSTTELPRQHPTSNPYPVAYPRFEIYPSTVDKDGGNCSRLNDRNSEMTSAFKETAYPFFNLYPNLYPFLEIYPPLNDTTLSSEENEVPLWRTQQQPSLTPMYPSFDPYPGVYPHLDIYPSSHEMTKTSTFPMNLEIWGNQTVGSVGSMQAYPYFNIYPSIYPYFDIYPAPYFETNQYQSTYISALSSIPPTIDVRAATRYPIFNLYPAVYPHFDLYPPLLEVPSVKLMTNLKPSSRLTHAELHAMVMMETGSFKSMSRSGGTETHSRSGTLLSGEIEADSRFNLRGSLTSTRKTQTTLAHPQDVKKSFKQESLSSGVNFANHNSYSIRPSQSPRPSLAFRQLARSGSLHEPTGSLPPRPASFALDRTPTGLPSLHEQDHAEVATTKPLARKRDSIVLQRIKAYDSTVEFLGGSTKDTIAKFPMPPKIPLPPLPMDRAS